MVVTPAGTLSYMRTRTAKEPTDYALRVQEAMTLRGVKKAELAAAIGVSYQAVRQLLNGESNSFSVPAHARAARFLSVDDYWLATGEGVPTRTDHTPLATEVANWLDAMTSTDDRIKAWAINAQMMRGQWPEFPSEVARPGTPSPAPPPTTGPVRSR